VTRPKVLLVDDHKIVCEGLVRLLSDRCDIVGTLSDGWLVADAVSQFEPDVLVLDMSMPGLSGLDVIRRLRQERSEIRIIVLTMHADPDLACEALRAGASGFVPKESSGEDLLTSIETVMKGNVYISPGLATEIARLTSDTPDR
jgi:DNA-binding NarL/FixJ family response regulator